MATRTVRAVAFLANFTIAKAVIYLAPLGVAAFASPAVYAALEFSFALAPFIVIALGSPVLAAVPQLYLVRRDLRIFDLVAMIAGCGLALMLAAGGVALLVSAPVTALLLLASAMTLAQGAASTLARTLSRRFATAWVDGFATLSMAAAAAFGLVVLGEGSGAQGAAIFYGLLVVPLLVLSVVLWKRWQAPHLHARLYDAARIGLPMVANGLYSLWVSSSGRIFFGFYAVVNDLAAYAVGFRIAGLMLGLHQLMVTAAFARAYGARTREFDRFAGAYLALVAIGGVGLCLFAPPVLPHLDLKALPSDRVGDLSLLLPLIGMQVYLWIVYATLEMRINRARLAARMILPNAPIGILSFAGVAALAAAGMVTPTRLVVATILLTAAFVGVQWLTLARRGLPLPRIGFVAIAGVLAFLLVAVIG